MRRAEMPIFPGCTNIFHNMSYANRGCRTAVVLRRTAHDFPFPPCDPMGLVAPSPVCRLRTPFQFDRSWGNVARQPGEQIAMADIAHAPAQRWYQGIEQRLWI